LLADNTLSLQIIDALCHDMHDIEWWVYLLDWREFYAKLLKKYNKPKNNFKMVPEFSYIF
jgi:deoxyribodipyrimidine photolyase